MMNGGSSHTLSYSGDGGGSGTFKIDRLPTIVFHEILSYFKYEELAACRSVNQFFKRNVEKRLNDAFMRLGRELTDLSVLLKRRLPRKESERKDHPLNRYSEIVSAMETRYTLLSMTYKKYMDANLTCFIPGKVLDLSFNVLNMIKDYVNRDVYMQLNAINVMRDIRDYSTMATEHFELHISPGLSRRCHELVHSRGLLNGHRFLGTPPIMRSPTNFITSMYNFASLTTPFDFEAELMSPSQAGTSKTSEQLDAQSKQLEDLRKLVAVQNNAILHIGEVLNELTKHLSPAQSSNFSALVEKMNTNSECLQRMFTPPTSSTTASEPTASIRKAPSEWLMKHNKTVTEPTTPTTATGAKSRPPPASTVSAKPGPSGSASTATMVNKKTDAKPVASAKAATTQSMNNAKTTAQSKGGTAKAATGARSGSDDSTPPSSSRYPFRHRRGSPSYVDMAGTSSSAASRKRRSTPKLKDDSSKRSRRS